MNPQIEETTTRHIQELRQLVADDIITMWDHDRIGLVMCDSIANLVNLTDTGWETFKRIIDESRQVQQSL